MRARLLAGAFCAALLTLGSAVPARAGTDSVLVRVAGSISGRAGNYVEVPITVDLSGAPGRALGSYSATLRFNPGLLEFQGAGDAGFGTPQVNTNHASDSGMVVLAAIQPSGASGTVVIFNAHFYVLADTAQSPITVSFNEMSATATSVTPFESLLGLLRIVNGTFCRSLGRWGDANGDGQANSLDALVALSYVVGIPVDTTVANPALMDVDADGKVTSRDALIVLSYAVGLPVLGYRILLTAPGACGTGDVVAITVVPDSLELQVGQSAFVLFDARDATGRSVSVDSGAVTSSNPSVANYVRQYEGPDILQARAPGVAVFTAQAGPGVAVTFKVVVLARRTTWYVDVLRASLAPTQLGNQAYPMEAIGDALALAHDGDTVLVASGTYEEVVSQQVSVTLLGDSINRPVIDPRGAPSWSSYEDALDLGSYTGKVDLENFIVRAGDVYLDAHDFVVRNVRIDGVNMASNYNAMLELYSENLTPAPAPLAGAGPMRSSGMPLSLGNVLVDGVVVAADSTYHGIVVDQADSVEIRNSTVTRAAAGTYPYCGPSESSYSGILVTETSVSRVHDNTVVNPYCQGLGVFGPVLTPLAGDVGRATISHNRITGAPNAGIVTSARVVALDHNVIRNTGLVQDYRTYGRTAGVHVIQTYSYAIGQYVSPDSVFSVGDSILNSGGRGFAVDSALAGVVDSLVIGGSGQDSSGYGAYGVDLERGGRFVLSHSHVFNTYGDNGVNLCGDYTVTRSHGNRIVGAGYNGISSYSAYCYGNGGGGAPVARAGSPAGPMRAGGASAGGPDTLISVADTILNSYASGIHAYDGVLALVDSAVVDSAGTYNGIEAGNLSTLRVQNSSFRRASNAGIYANYADSVWSLRNTLSANVSFGAYFEYLTDTARVYGNVIDGTGAWGISAYDGVRLVVDSTAVTNSGASGLRFDYLSGGRVTRSRLDGNHGFGIEITSSYDTLPVIVRQSTIQHNDSGGAANFVSTYTTLDADMNYWGDPNGPRCGVAAAVTGCSGLGTGDSIVTLGVSFANWLTAAASPTPAPRFALAAPRRSGVSSSALTVTGAGQGRAASGFGSARMRPGATLAPQPQSSAATATSPRGRRQYAPAWQKPRAARPASAAAKLQPKARH